MKRELVQRQQDVTSYSLSRHVAKLDMKGVRKSVLRVLADHYPNVWPSVETIASQAGFGTTAVRQALRSLERDGYISPIGHRRGGRRASGQYLINVEAINLEHSWSETQRQTSPFSNPTFHNENPTPGVQNPTPGVEEQSNNRLRIEKENHHASGALKDWLSIKANLKRQLPEAQFKLWVRPMYLLKLMGRQMLLALPPNGAMMDAAKTHVDILQKLVRELGYDGCSLTRYPTGYERERLEKEYPQFYAHMFGNQNRKTREQSPAA